MPKQVGMDIISVKDLLERQDATANIFGLRDWLAFFFDNSIMSLREAYERSFISLKEVKLSSPCNRRVSTDRDLKSKETWQGDIRVELRRQDKIFDADFSYEDKDYRLYLGLYSYPRTRTNFNGYDKDHFAAAPIIPNGELFVFRSYIGANGKWLRSSNPDLTFRMHMYPEPIINSVSPNKVHPEENVQFVIRGRNLAVDSRPTGVQFMKNSRSHTLTRPIKPDSASSKKVIVTWKISDELSPGDRLGVYVNHCQNAYVDDVILVEKKQLPDPPPTPPDPKPSEKTKTIRFKRQNIYSGSIYYLARINIPGGVLKSIQNLNLGLGKQWTVNLIKDGTSSEDCGKAGKTIDLRPGSSTDYFKGVSLSGNKWLGFCLTPNDTFTASRIPSEWSLKFTYTK